MPALFALGDFVKIVDTSTPPYIGRIVGLENVIPEQPYTDGRPFAAQWVYYIKVAPKQIVEALESTLVAAVEPTPDPQR